jgi:hypothetical protein
MEMPAGTWSITAVIMQDFVQKGAFVSGFTIPEGTTKLYIYVPYIIYWPQDKESQTWAALAMNNILLKCGIGPVSLTPVEPKTCIVGYDEVWT